MRKHYVLIAAVALAACASEPAQKAVPASSPVAPAPVTSSAAVSSTQSVASSAAAASEDGAFNAPAGYQKKTRGSKTLYCKSETPVGTRFAKEYCFTQEQLEAKEANRADAVEQMDRGRRTCTGGCAGG